MKILSTVLMILSFSIVFGQSITSYDFGKNSSFYEITDLPNGKQKLGKGYLSGDFRGIDNNDYIRIWNNKLIFKDTDGEICYRTKKISLRNATSVGFKVDIKGTGTLDKNPNRSIYDWVDISYFLDGEQVSFESINPDNFEKRQHYIEGVPQNFNSRNIEITGQKYIEIMFCVLNTGDDETYLFENFKIWKERSDKTNNQQTDIAESKIDLSPIMGYNDEIAVFPNPSSDWLRIRNESLFNLSSIMIYNESGLPVKKKPSYPIHLTDLSPGNYYLMVECLRTKEQVTIPFVFIRK